MTLEANFERRATIHAALADPRRLEIVDELMLSERSPSELSSSLAMGSNLLAHHLGVLQQAGLVERLASAGDGRRRYVRLDPDVLSLIGEPTRSFVARHVLFVCSANSARSQLAAAAWNSRHEVPASSAGTRPAFEVRPGAVEAAARAGLDMGAARPRSIDSVTERPDIVVTVCDLAREELGTWPGRVRLLHWSVPDPALMGTARAFDDALSSITSRVETLGPRVRSPRRPRRSRP